MCKNRFSFLAAALLVFAFAALADVEQPVGVLLSPGGSKLLKANVETPLAAKAGDLLFTGDGLRTETTPASFLFCPGKTLNTLGPAGEVRFDAKTPKVKTGKISEQPARSCSLPTTLRVSIASQQHYGVTMTRGDINKPEVPPVPRDQLSAEVKAALAPLDTALATDPKDQAALIAEAAVFENNKLPSNALEVYFKLREQWPDVEWIKSKVFELQTTIAEQLAAAVAPAPGGQTFALLVGITKYKKPELSLQYPDRDASVFADLLKSPRGGGIPAGNILLLTDDGGTTAAVRNGFDDFLKRRAGKNDTVIILVASHGTVDDGQGYILTYDADPQDLKSTALPMVELKGLFDAQLARVGRVLLFVDVCKSGVIGTIHTDAVNSKVQNFRDVAEGQLLGLMAARPRQLSIEGPQYGGGHGAFSYFVLKGLEGAADENGDGAVDGNELIQYVTSQVPKATGGKQNPIDISPGTVDVKISDIKKPGINLAFQRMILDLATGQPRYVASNSPEPAFFEEQAAEDVDRFNAALNAGRILPDQPDSAFNILQKLQSELSPEQYKERENQLEIALENKAQEVLLRYLQGEETPQTKDDFSQGGRYMQAARQLIKESLFLEGRQDFFSGRAMLFDKQFPQAAQLLEDSVRFDPNAAYGYNALGIAYLEQAQYERAIPAFRDATRRATHWAYPWHNVALAYVETGDYRNAIRAYQEAIRLAPQYSYLPYNLGLVYQRINRRKDAEASYKKAIELEPDKPEPYNALGTLKASQGKRAEAERLYRESLQKNSKLLAARHNLAILLFSEKGREQEAIDLWRQNLNDSPDYLPSRINLAGALAERGDNAGAIQEYRAILNVKPDYVAARTALAGLLAKTGDADSALQQLRDLSQKDAQNFSIFEQIGDLEASRKHGAEARAAYQSALKLAPDRGARKRINNKLKALP